MPPFLHWLPQGLFTLSLTPHVNFFINPFSLPSGGGTFHICNSEAGLSPLFFSRSYEILLWSKFSSAFGVMLECYMPIRKGMCLISRPLYSHRNPMSCVNSSCSISGKMFFFFKPQMFRKRICWWKRRQFYLCFQDKLGGICASLT